MNGLIKNVMLKQENIILIIFLIKIFFRKKKKNFTFLK